MAGGVGVFRSKPGIAAVAALAVVGLMSSACVIKDPKFSSASIPDAALAHDALIMIGSDADTTILNAPPSLCSDPRFGRRAGRTPAGAVTIPCWDGS